MRPIRLAIVTSHPIQYNAPLFRALATRADIRVYFAHRQSAAEQGAAGYGVAFDWDVDLLEGYPHVFLCNRAARPGVDRFSGCNTPEIAGLLRGGGFDACLVTGWNLRAYWQAVQASHRGGLPVFVRGDSQLGTARSPAKRAIKMIVYPTLLRRFDGFLYVGSRNREYLQHYGAAADRLFFAPHCVDNSRFEAAAAAARPARDAIRASWGATPTDVVLLFVGRLVEFKRPADLILAAESLRGYGVQIRPVFVGAGPLETELRRLAQVVNLGVHFAGFRNQSELPSCYTAADMLVLCSGGEETWGLVVNEAMACGLPAVVSDAAGCAPDLIDPFRTGARYRMGDIPSLVQAVRGFVPMLGAEEVARALQAKVRAYSAEAAADGVLHGAGALRS
jgi:glycosyltransferase involved in cell wall biosynthesis